MNAGSCRQTYVLNFQSRSTAGTILYKVKCNIFAQVGELTCIKKLYSSILTNYSIEYYSIEIQRFESLKQPVVAYWRMLEIEFTLDLALAQTNSIVYYTREHKYRHFHDYIILVFTSVKNRSYIWKNQGSKKRYDKYYRKQWVLSFAF